ncbi:sushi, von Willebrand factor type A, EGF and pentraxin domain-containing protein 1-like [Haliotis rufescens]|uniref:sushi, von Willebrand factor type A, EGF and pentraxin domain-containing protein 1-like n=1 Tax=Haliotis rufescens TaxID=6454 RepID=UPI00201FA643|nr:sushi, von Willebrand factor type A, EGF and pentraxin domain-containing protein 1-like [Haliotis rufescens]XP_048243840.1 sushi, von Willebrand factor type A, EGF and pentraxin domain-containing protein 1-like [Haliotis rufescens]XP_048243841.1 sushi, von Willebrand factor type A, EGF and pentraxin domain-containing protein 1-like [Haliotis rufescens]
MKIFCGHVSAYLLWMTLSASLASERNKTKATRCQPVLRGDKLTSCHVSTDQPTTVDVSGFLPHGVICASKSKSCYVCHNGELLPADCSHGRLLKRSKRFWGSVGRDIENGLNKFAKDVHRGWRETERAFKKLGNIAPTLYCPHVDSEYVAPRGSTSVRVVWGKFRIRDNAGDTSDLTRLTPKGPGSYFGKGPHRVVYKVTDSFGLSDTCTIRFRVKVRECEELYIYHGTADCTGNHYGASCSFSCDRGYTRQGSRVSECGYYGTYSPSPPTCDRVRCSRPYNIHHGYVYCSGSYYGSKCSFSCEDGYQLQGYSSSRCEGDGTFSSLLPTCKIITCDEMMLPRNAKSKVCTNGNVYQSECHPVCKMGYETDSSATCTEGGWLFASWQCEDRTDPTFTGCPNKTVHTLDTNYYWQTPIATDTTGDVTVKQVYGQIPGSTFDYGSHLIQYEAEDASGNSDTCAFLFNVQKMECPKPLVNDTDMKFTCNGLTVQSVCRLSCQSGTFVQGSKYITCVRSDNTSFWEPLDGDAPSCYMPELPDEYAMPTEFYYFGECVNEETLLGIKEQFLNNLQGLPCYHAECSIQDVQVSCGEVDNDSEQEFLDNWDFKRRRRDASYRRRLEIRVIFHLKNTNRTTSLTAAKMLLERFAAMSLSFLDANLMPSMDSPSMPTTLKSKAASPTLLSDADFNGNDGSGAVDDVDPTMSTGMFEAVSGELTMSCPPGEVLLSKQAGLCVPCAKGSYAEKNDVVCTPCPMHHYQEKMAATSCKLCPKLHITLFPGADTCIALCSKGFFSMTGTEPCFPCPAGWYQYQRGATTCQKCADEYEHPTAEKQPECDSEVSRNETALTPDQQVSEFLLTCQAEDCLSFGEGANVVLV